MRRTAGPCALIPRLAGVTTLGRGSGGIQQVYTHTFTSKAEMYPADERTDQVPAPGSTPR